MTREASWALLPAGLVALWLLMMVAGTGPLDRAVIDAIYTAHRPNWREAAVVATMLGQWQLLFPLTLIIGIVVIVQRAFRQSIFFLAIVLVGRLLVELQKIGFARHRPELQHLVAVKSQSFPSGHSANSMIIGLSIALLIVPPRHRHIALPVAVAVSILVGISRPMLGVHWPSDVIGGWSFGAAWVLTMVGLAERWPFGRDSTHEGAIG